jgi:FkbM family methyltransferase
MELSEFVYTVLLKPRPLRMLANATLRVLSPKRKRLGDAWWTPNPNDPVVSGAAALGVYERPETAFFKEVCQPTMTFVDIGANTGYYSAWAISLLQGQGQIIAIEPDPEALRYLASTRDANKSSIMSVMPYAASSQEGTCVLFRNPDNRGDNRLYENDLCQDQAIIDAKTVDTMLTDLGVMNVDLIKIDVQGFEGHVLQGMKETLRRSRKVTILMEFWPWGLHKAGTDASDLLAFLADLGFVLFELKRDGLLKIVSSHSALVERLEGRRYTNLVGVLRRAVEEPFSVERALAVGS